MPNDYDDPYATDDSAVFLTGFKGTVLKSFWDTPAGQAIAAERDVPTFDNATRPQLYWNVRVDDITQEDYEGDTAAVLVQISIGGGWHADEEGVFVEHQDDTPDKLKKFRKDSRLGQIIELTQGRADEYKDVDKTDNDADPIYYDMTGVDKVIRSRGGPRDSRIWNGTQWQFRGVGTQFKDQKMRDVRVKPLPVEYLGLDGEVEDSGSPGPVEQTEPLTYDPAAVSLKLPDDTDPETVDILTRILSSATSHTDFVRQAVVVDGVKKNADVAKAVSDEKNGPWSLVVA